jgi:NitT/TauT family transport system permease protein
VTMNDSSNVAVAVAPADVAPAGITRKTFFEANESSILGMGFIAAVLAIWEVVPRIFTLSKATQLFFATPSQVMGALYDLFATGEIWPALEFSATAFTVGLLLSIAVALPVGVVLGRSTSMNAMFDPFVTAFNATPRLVFLPIVLIWFGIGMNTVVIIVFIGAVFPLLINTYEGVKNADKLLINVVRSFGAREWKINTLVVLPNSMPYIIAGLRLAIGRAILGIVVAEFFGGTTTGVGVIMVNASGKYQVDLVFAGLVLFMAISLVMTSAVRVLEQRLSRWRPEKVKNF